MLIMKNIVFLDAETLGTDLNLDHFNEQGEVTVYQKTAPDQVVSRAADAEIIVTNKVVIDADVMNRCNKLKLICISATGMNNVDLETAKAKGITVKNAVGYSSQSVAQHTFAMLFHLLNQLSYYDTYVKNGDYAKSEIFTHYGPLISELNDKTFGIIGLGNIGKTVAHIAEVFGAKVCYYSTSGKNTNTAYLQVTFDQLLETCDIITIHAPLNDRTKNLISTNEFAKMKASAILVNVGRGGIVDEHALADAVNDNIIGGAGVDVFVNEPIDACNPLLKVLHPEKLVLSPHNAWASVEARTSLIQIVYKNIAEFNDKKS
jgi:lactate dehydrogenase-like 2-hydroxyacid dehydrogenase